MTSTIGDLGASMQRGRRRVPALVPDASALARQAVALLLTRPWLARLPLVDEGAETMEQTGLYTEVCVLAVRWNGAANGPITDCVVAVPVAATGGLQESFETFMATIHTDGPSPETGETAEVAVLYYGADFLRDKLAESSPSGATVISFSPVGAGGLPIGAEIVDMLDLPGEFSSGTLAKTRLDDHHNSEVILYDLAVGEDEYYITAVSTAEDEAVNPLVALSMAIPHGRRRATSAGAALDQESMFGPLSGRPASLAAVLGAQQVPPSAAAAAATPRPKTAAVRAKAGSTTARSKAPTLTQVMEAVTGIANRLTTIEQAGPPGLQRPPPALLAPSGISPLQPPQPCAAPLGPQSSLLAPGRIQAPTTPGLTVPG
eukprot:6490406-Amphidinium_carterae.1